jgi:hypothetical protein
VKVAALYVEENGVYANLQDVEVWGISRDARLYAGPHPVVAHPPCERWGRYADGGWAARDKRIAGADGGCFEAAFAAVRKLGGVLEHPEGSSAFDAFGIPKPDRGGGWKRSHNWAVFTCCVEQRHYGHRARKATWLVAATDGVLPELIWGPSVGEQTRRMREAVTEEEKRRARKTGVVQNLSAKQRRATPPAFRDLLLSIARTARTQERAA